MSTLLPMEKRNEMTGESCSNADPFLLGETSSRLVSGGCFRFFSFFLSFSMVELLFPRKILSPS